MTLCNFCNRRESRTRRFSEPFVCVECYNDSTNRDINKDEITYVDAYNNRYGISSDTEIEVVKSQEKLNNNTKSDAAPINVEDNYKDALLASLYTQVEFLKSQLIEKDILIKTLLIKEHDYYYTQNLGLNHSGENVNNRYDKEEKDGSNRSITGSSGSESSGSESSGSTSGEGLCEVHEDDIDNYDDFFEGLYKQYEKDKEKELQNQLVEVRRPKHNLYQGLAEQKEKLKKPGTNYHNNEKENTDPHELWPPNTILILGDSMVNQMDAQRLSRSSKSTQNWILY